MRSGYQNSVFQAARYLEVEERYWYCKPGQYAADPKELVNLVDENTILVCAIIGTTYTGRRITESLGLSWTDGIYCRRVRGRSYNQRLTGGEEQEGRSKRSNSRRCCFRRIRCALRQAGLEVGLPKLSGLLDQYFR